MFQIQPFLCSVWMFSRGFVFEEEKKACLFLFPNIFAFATQIQISPPNVLFISFRFVSISEWFAVFLPEPTHSTAAWGGSCLFATHHLLFWILQLSVGCSIFLIVANFLVQFYANFTWMFMNLSAATKKKCLNTVDRDYCAMKK